MAGGVLGIRRLKLFRGTIDFKAGAAGAEGEEQEDDADSGDDAVNQTIPLILCAEGGRAGQPRRHHRPAGRRAVVLPLFQGG